MTTLPSSREQLSAHDRLESRFRQLVVEIGQSPTASVPLTTEMLMSPVRRAQIDHALALLERAIAEAALRADENPGPARLALMKLELTLLEMPGRAAY
jgi:hypothetical protein